MLGIIYGLLTYSIFAFHGVNMKKLSRYLSPRESVSIHFYFVPLGIISFLLAIYLGGANVSSDLPRFLGLSLIFAGTVSASLLFGFYVYQKLNLSSTFKLRSGISILLALLIDFFFYETVPSAASFIGATLFIASGFLLGDNKAAQQEQSNINFKYIIIILAIAVLVMCNRVILKEITLITTNDFAGIYLTQTITQFCVFLCGYQYLKKVSHTKEVQHNIIWYTLIIYIGVIFEFYLHRYASLFIIIVLRNIKFFIFLFFDYKNKDLHLGRKQISGIILGLIGIATMVFFEWQNIVS